MNKTFTMLLSAAATVGTALAQAPTLVADIHNTATGNSSVVDGKRVGWNDEHDEDSFAKVTVGATDYWYFAAETSTTGQELWRTDGTAAGTTMVMDINPGGAGSSPQNLTPYYGVGLFFTADDGTNGRELWFTNGITTQMMGDINPAGSSSPDQLAAVAGFLFFRANDGTTGTELYRSDTTVAGTGLFADIRVGASSSTPTNITPIGGGADFVFSADDGINGRELWLSDGTPAGTAMLVDINVGSSSISTSDRFLPLGTDILFEANDGTNGTELWKTDGTAAGTVLVKDIRLGAASSSINFECAVVHLGYLYFIANDGTGNELWRTDGTGPGTTLEWDSNTSSATASGNPGRFQLHNGEMFFRAQVNDGITNYGTYELCKVDALGVPSLVVDFNPGTGTSLAFSTDFMSHNGLLYFAGDNGSGTGSELCVSDGTAAGTMLLKDINPGTSFSAIDYFTPISATQLMFIATEPTYGEELWVTDGTAAGTQLLAECDAGLFTPDSDPSGFLSLNGKDLIFTAKIPGGTGNEELCKWEPGVGVSIVADIRPGDTGSAIDEADWTYARLGGQDVVVFTANDGTSGNELFVSDGTNAGTYQIVDLYPGTSSGSTGDQLVYYKGRVYFEGTDGPAPGSATGNELWATDGTAAGTVLVKDIHPTSASGILMFDNNIIYKDELYFRANDGVNGTELWKTDGTAAGTVMVADINPAGSSNPNYPVIFNDVLLFQANDGTNGSEVWVWDGTTATMLADLNVTGNANPMSFGGTAELNGWLYFRADGNDGVTDFGIELYRTNLVTTELVIDLNPSAFGNGFAGNLHRVGNSILFVGNDGSTGGEWWKTDGTAAGTSLVLDINPLGANGITATDIRVDSMAVGTGIYFEADDGVNGDELWFTDGTAAGTYMVADINPFGDSQNTTWFGLANGQLFFVADNGTFGDELYTIASPGASAFSIGHSGDGTRLDCTPPVMGQPWEYSFQQAPQFGTPMSSGGIALGSVRIWGNAIDSSFAFPSVTDADSSIWFDLALSPIVLEFNPFSSGSGGFVMPFSPAFIGVRIHLQSLTLRTTITPFGTSNGISMYLGN